MRHLSNTGWAMALAIAAGLAFQGAALAAGGTALGVDPQAEAQASGITRVLTVGADVSIGERIVTGPKGLVQIKFSDNTELVVGPNSQLVLEDYLLRDNGSAGKLAINALTGTFRFATGLAAKDRYVIKTPTGTIGIRGTALDFDVDDVEGTKVLVFHGTVRLCNLANVCVTLDGSCEVGTYDTADAQVLGPTTEMDDATRDLLRDQFEWAESQAPLLPAFWVDKARDCLNEPVVHATFPSLSQSNDSPVYVAPVVEEVPDEICDYDDDYYSGSY